MLNDRFVLQIPEAGFHFVAWLRRESDFPRVARARAAIGIRPLALSFLHRGEAEAGVCARFCGVDIHTNSREPRQARHRIEREGLTLHWVS